MSYCRLGEDSDVGVYYSVNNVLVCVHPEHYDGNKCPHIKDGEHTISMEFKTYSEMIEHLRTHRNFNDKVPKKVISALMREQQNNGNILGRRKKPLIKKFYTHGKS